MRMQEQPEQSRQSRALQQAMLQELYNAEQDWDTVAGLCCRSTGAELGAIQRQLRGFDSIDTLLRVLLIHLAAGCSLRETAARAQAAGLSKVSDIALK
jgi:hypothetical protein